MKINENLVLDSRVKRTSTYGVRDFILSKDLEIGKQYTLSFEGEVVPDDKLGLWMGGGWVQIKANIKPNKEGNRFYITFEVPDWNSDKFTDKHRENLVSNQLVVYVWPRTEGYFIAMENTKLEKGTEMTPYVPNVADVKNNSLYPNKVGGGYLGGNTTLVGGVVYAS